MLVSVSTYQVTTGDTSTAASAASGFLYEAQELLEELLDRQLESAERTETLLVRHRGLVYPRALPVTAISVASDATGDVVHSGFGVRLTSAPEALVTLTDVSSTRYDDTAATTADLTYTGGYTSATLPTTLRRAICRVARALTVASGYDGGAATPAGVTSVSLGDASISWGSNRAQVLGAAALLDELVPGLPSTLTGYRRNEDW